MAPRPKRHGPELPRRGEHGETTVLPVAGCGKRAPAWPVGEPTDDELSIWESLWALPVAAWWWEVQVSSLVVSRYVTLRISKPEHAATGQLERELALTPASMARAKLVVGRPEPKRKTTESPYRELFDELGV